MVVDFLKLPAAKIGQVGVGLDPGPFAPNACVSGASKIRPRIAPPRASGRRMLLIVSPLLSLTSERSARKMNRQERASGGQMRTCAKHLAAGGDFTPLPAIRPCATLSGW